jgi:hypothetical protein
MIQRTKFFAMFLFLLMAWLILTCLMAVVHQALCYLWFCMTLERADDVAAIPASILVALLIASAVILPHMDIAKEGQTK